MIAFKALLLATAVIAVKSQGHNGPTTTPVPILKQINRQNDDGSYSYGYEAADGSFKIETKYPSGDVAGKYGYVDENGKLREITYGASSKRGFEPEGAGIQVPPPTLHDPSNALTDGQEDDGQYREDPKIYEDPKYNGRQRQPAQTVRQYHRPAQPAQPAEPEYAEPEYQPSFPSRQAQPQRAQYQTQTSFQDYQPQQSFQQYQSQPQQNFQQYQPQTQTQTQSLFRGGPLFQQQTSLFSQAPQQFPQENRPQSQVYHQQPQFSYQAFTPQPYTQTQTQTQNYQPQNYQPQPQPQNYQQQSYQPQNYNQFGGHPAQNFDPSTGSYTINFTG